LAPKFFALFVDELLVSLKNSGLGCYINKACFNSFMYADDLLLLSISITHLQKMIDLCIDVLGSCDLQINPKKSFCLRIGPRHNITNCILKINNQHVIWKSEFKYLGVTIVSSKKFKCNLQGNRQKFFQATNSIFGKLGTKAPLNLTLSLIDIFCIPVLLYALEALNLTKSERSTLDFTYSTVFFKLFKVKDKLNIKLCQFYSGCLPPSCRLDIKKLNFVNALQFLKNSMPMQLIAIGGREEFVSLANKYKLASYDRGFLIKSKVLEWFASDLSI
jgi:hypothetical protein